MNLNYKNRIAFQFMFATALIIAVVFTVVFFIVRGVVYENIDEDLSYEAHKHTTEINITNDSIWFINKKEWEEREHREAEVNPVFIQIMSDTGKLMDKSPNLKEQFLIFDKNHKFGTYFVSSLSGTTIRQVQIPIELNGKIKGYILAAMSLEASTEVLNRLKNVLFISFPLILIGLFFVSQLVAGRSIKPIKDITKTTKKITQNNLNERVNIPGNKDELFDLSTSFNNLLNRIERAFERERQFTSDASHELRTPISSIQGTLEVLIRKERKPEEYIEKVAFSLNELSRMSSIIDQLLLLARLDNQKIPESDYDLLSNILKGIQNKYANIIGQKSLHFNINYETLNETLTPVKLPVYYANLLFENLINNAIKYTSEGGKIQVNLEYNDGRIICRITDNGIGIKKEDLTSIFNPFFRSEPLTHRETKGTGLGLSIAQKAAKAMHATLKINSEIGIGTEVLVYIKPA